MSLLQLKMGQQGVLKDIEWGQKLKHKLYDMGLTPGTTISIISSSGRGPLIIGVRGSRLAIGRGIGAKITVNPVVSKSL